MAIIDIQHSPKKPNSEVDLTATRLIIASKRGELDAVQRLLNLGADNQLKSSNGNIALALVIRKGHVHVAIFLLDRLVRCLLEAQPLIWASQLSTQLACIFT